MAWDYEKEPWIARLSFFSAAHYGMGAHSYVQFSAPTAGDALDMAAAYVRQYRKQFYDVELLAYNGGSPNDNITKLFSLDFRRRKIKGRRAQYDAILALKKRAWSRQLAAVQRKGAAAKSAHEQRKTAKKRSYQQRRARLRTIQSRYQSVCPACNMYIREGDDIAKVQGKRGAKWIHAHCALAPKEDLLSF